MWKERFGEINYFVEWLHCFFSVFSLWVYCHVGTNRVNSHLAHLLETDKWYDFQHLNSLRFSCPSLISVCPTSVLLFLLVSTGLLKGFSTLQNV